MINISFTLLLNIEILHNNPTNYINISYFTHRCGELV